MNHQEAASVFLLTVMISAWHLWIPDLNSVVSSSLHLVMHESHQSQCLLEKSTCLPFHRRDLINPTTMWWWVFGVYGSPFYFLASKLNCVSQRERWWTGVLERGAMAVYVVCSLCFFSLLMFMFLVAFFMFWNASSSCTMSLFWAGVKCTMLLLEVGIADNGHSELVDVDLLVEIVCQCLLSCILVVLQGRCAHPSYLGWQGLSCQIMNFVLYSIQCFYNYCCRSFSNTVPCVKSEQGTSCMGKLFFCILFLYAS